MGGGGGLRYPTYGVWDKFLDYMEPHVMACVVPCCMMGALYGGLPCMVGSLYGVPLYDAPLYDGRGVTVWSPSVWYPTVWSSLVWWGLQGGPFHPDRLTDSCENNTFPIPRMRAVGLNIWSFN